MTKALGMVAAIMVVPALAFVQAGQGASASPNGAAPPARPASLVPPPPPALTPTKRIDAVYTDRAERAGVEGDVWLDVSVHPDGTIRSVLIAKSLDTVFGLDQAAVAAVKQWRYSALPTGQTVRPPMRVVVPFRLTRAPAAAAPIETQEEFGKDAIRPSGRDARIVMPKPKHQVAPVYTTAGLRARIAGPVTVEAVVMADGTVGEARVIQSLDGPTGLDDQALGAAREWVFEPGTLDDRPVSVIVTFVLNFNLR
jgi:TonB family protein